MNALNNPSQSYENLLDKDGVLSLKERQQLQNYAKDVSLHPFLINTLEKISVQKIIDKIDKLDSDKSREHIALMQLYLCIKGYSVSIDGQKWPQTMRAIQKFLGKSSIDENENSLSIKKISKKESTKEKKKETIKLSEQERIEFARNILSQWYDKHIVDGILWNLMIESRLNPHAVGDSWKAHGIAQWHADREKPLIRKWFATRTLDWWLRAIKYELDNNESKAREMLLASKTVEEAAHNFDKYYERSNGKTRADRVAYAVQFSREEPRPTYAKSYNLTDQKYL